MEDTYIPRLNNTSLWIGAVGSPVVWALHFLLVWSLVEMGCGYGLGDTRFLGINGVHAAVLLVTLAAVAGILFTAATAYQNLQRVKTSASGAHDPMVERALERSQFMAVVGMAFSSLFLVIVLYVAVPVFVLPPCNQPMTPA